jgi:hypothetical protein
MKMVRRQDLIDGKQYAAFLGGEEIARFICVDDVNGELNFIQDGRYGQSITGIPPYFPTDGELGSLTELVEENRRGYKALLDYGYVPPKPWFEGE